MRRNPLALHLRHVWRATWRPRQHSTLLPYAAGIHRVGNPTDRPAISLHLYGPPTSAIDGRDYDASRDFVCDRLPERLPLTLGEGWGEGAASQVRAA
jgi:hypothetical protein